MGSGQRVNDFSPSPLPPAKELLEVCRFPHVSIDFFLIMFGTYGTQSGSTPRLTYLATSPIPMCTTTVVAGFSLQFY